MTAEYRMSLTELCAVLDYMNKEYVNKVPKKMLDFIKENKDDTYIPDIDANVPINEQNLKQETKILLSLLYRNYWCEEETKTRLIKEDLEEKKEYEKELNERFNPDNLFKNRVKENENYEKIEETASQENVQIVVYKKENIFKRFFKWIFGIFK